MSQDIAPVRVGSDFEFETAGNYILRDGVGRLLKPDYKEGIDTIVRLYPGYAPELATHSDQATMAWDPWRTGPKPGQFGQFYYPIQVVSVGDPLTTWIAHDPSDGNFDSRLHIVNVLYNAIFNSVRDRKDHAGWAGLITKQPGRGAPLAKISARALMGCCVIKHRGAWKSPPMGLSGDDNDKPVFLSLSGPTMRELFDLMDQRRPDFHGDPMDPAGFVHGDPISLNAGCFLQMIKKGGGGTQGPPQIGFGQRGAVDRGGDREREFAGYEMNLLPSLGSQTANLAAWEPLVRQRTVPFWKAVRVEPIEKQLAWLMNAFMRDPDVILYALGDQYGRVINAINPTFYAEGMRKLAPRETSGYERSPAPGAGSGFGYQPNFTGTVFGAPTGPQGPPAGFPGAPAATPTYAPPAQPAPPAQAEAPWGGPAPYQPSQPNPVEVPGQVMHPTASGAGPSFSPPGALYTPPPAIHPTAPPAAAPTGQPAMTGPSFGPVPGAQPTAGPNYGPPGVGAHAAPAGTIAPVADVPVMQAGPPADEQALILQRMEAAKRNAASNAGGLPR